MAGSVKFLDALAAENARRGTAPDIRAAGKAASEWNSESRVRSRARRRVPVVAAMVEGLARSGAAHNAGGALEAAGQVRIPGPCRPVQIGTGAMGPDGQVEAVNVSGRCTTPRGAMSRTNTEAGDRW